MSYVLIKHLHVSLAALTALSFSIRGMAALRGAAWLQRSWAKRLPHMIDSLLLVCGISLAVMAGLNPLVHAWLGLKLVLLLAYIGLGVLTLKSASGSPRQRLAFALALLALLGIFHLATHKPLW